MASINLGYTPRKWQHEVHLAMASHRWCVLVAHRRSGKTVLALLSLIDAACKLSLKNGRYAYIAPLLKQAKTISWTYLKHYASKIPGTEINESELRVTLPNGAEIRLYGADNPDALRGIYLDGVVLDEIGQMNEDIWESIIRPTLSDRRGWALFMGTPKGVNWLSKVYTEAIGKADWTRHLFTVNQTDSIDPTEVASLKRDMPDAKFAREYLCDFNAAVENILLSFDQVEAATKRSYMLGDFQHGAKVIGVDVARQGDDATVIIRRQGMMVYAPKEYRIPDAMLVADKVAFEINEWKPDAVFVDGTGGYGAGVIDRLRQLGHRVIEVQFSASPGDSRFLNKRAEMWWDMAEAIKNNLQIPSHNQLKQDLCTPTYGFNNASKMVLESKELIKQRGMPSPDFADALAVTFASKVTPAAFMAAKDADFIVTQKKWNPLGKVSGYKA